MTKEKIFLLLLCFLFIGCDRTKPPIQFFPDMKNQKSVRPQAQFREPPANTVPRKAKRYPFSDPEGAEKKLKNPLTPTADTLNRGQFMYNAYCLPCHNSNGEGFGPVVKRGFAPPPPLSSEKVKQWSDGRLFHIITKGQGIMSSYASQVDPIDRWAIILYIRALQKAHGGKVNGAQ
ncbi:MAG: cytochrome c [Deltaproteobacteria bacterium]|nr:cytochrome c [Deltaproteobacteria bacterium]